MKEQRIKKSKPRKGPRYDIDMLKYEFDCKVYYPNSYLKEHENSKIKKIMKRYLAQQSFVDERHIEYVANRDVERLERERLKLAHQAQHFIDRSNHLTKISKKEMSDVRLESLSAMGSKQS